MSWIRFDDVHAVRLIAQAVEVQFVPKLHHCAASYNDRDVLMGGVLFTDYWGGSIGIHFAGFRPNWISRAIIYLAFDYPFRQLEVKKLVATIPEWNVRSRNNALHFGFKIEHLVSDIYNRRDGVNGMYICSMLRDDCRWLHMPMPLINYAPPERTNSITMPLASMPAIGMVQ